LQKEIKSAIQKNPDGIIVTHGTDTIQYTAAAIEYAFADANIPICFVSADYPLDNPKTNGYVNFEAAVEFIKTKKANGVFVTYKNDNESDVKIHIASRLLQHAENYANLYSINSTVFANYTEDKINFYNLKTNENPKPLGTFCYTENSHILSIESCPGNPYAYLLDDIKAVILKPYHSATLSTNVSPLKEFCQKANDKNIPVFVSSVPNGTAYESSMLFTELGIKVAPFSGYAALYMKLWAAISLNENIEAFLNAPIANESEE